MAASLARQRGDPKLCGHVQHIVLPISKFVKLAPFAQLAQHRRSP